MDRAVHLFDRAGAGVVEPMRIAMVGLGKLGLPVAAAMETAHEVRGFDVNDGAMLDAAQAGLSVATLADACRGADIVFVAVQTPHGPEFEGITRLPKERRDFDYTHLKAACKAVHGATVEGQVVVVISTVLPGTMEREIYPILAGRRVGYNPAFIAMGTVAQDFLNPEFVLLGSDDEFAALEIERFYSGLVSAPIYRTSVRNAELIKVAYNTFIGLKLAFANTLLEICEKTGCDVDQVTGALGLAHDRLISTQYLTAGMGDGGGCHPRDNIALSWLAQKLDLGFDLFEAVMMQREKQAEWLAGLMFAESMKTDLPMAIYGTAFKPEVGIETGSHAMLVAHILGAVRLYDPYVDGRTVPPDEPMVVLIGMRHAVVTKHQFAPGSVVIDPWRIIPDQDGVTVKRLGA